MPVWAAGPPNPRIRRGPAELRITRAFSCVARGAEARLNLMFAGCWWWRSLAIDGDSGAPRGHGPVMGRPASRCGIVADLSREGRVRTRPRRSTGTLVRRHEREPRLQIRLQ